MEIKKERFWRLGLLGETLGHSWSPEIHRKLFSARHLRGTYNLIEIRKEKIEREIPELFGLYDGLNVTIPYKVSMLPFLDDISGEALRTGAVNTILLRGGKAIGYNTDYIGIKKSLEKIHAPVKGEKAVVLGTGGASRAVLQCLYDEGADPIVAVSRDKSHKDPGFLRFAAERHITIEDYEDLASHPGGTLLVNATPVGMFPHTAPSPVSRETVSSFPKVMDCIYNPPETTFLSYARGDAINGLYMLVEQAASSEEIWMDEPVPESLVEEIVKEMTVEKEGNHGEK